jgi:hypothetical protein
MRDTRLLSRGMVDELRDGVSLEGCRRLKFVLAMCSGAVLGLACRPAAAADVPTPPTVETVPAQIVSNLSPDAPVELDVHLKAGSQPLSNISLTTFSADNIAVVLPADRGLLAGLNASSEYAWSLRLTHTDTLLGAAKLHLRVAFDVLDAGGRSSHRLLYSTVDIAPAAPSIAPLLAKAEAIGAATSVAHERPAQLLVQLTNQSNRTLHLATLTIFKPTFVCLSLGGDVCQTQQPIDLRPLGLADLPPGQTAMLPLMLRASSKVVPGLYTVMIGVQVESGGLNQTVTASHDINVAVLGESDLLKLVGVPSLLFLPGALLLITLSLCLSVGISSDDRKKLLLQPTEPGFWVLAIGLSLAAAVFYPSLTRLFGPERNYLASYGLEDFMYVFGWSIFGGILAFAAYLGGRRLKKLWQAREIRKQVPQPGDDPLTILGKLAKLKEDLACRQAYPLGGSAADAMLVLGPWSTDTELWIVPPALLKVTLPGSDPNYYVALDECDRLSNGEVSDAAAAEELIRAHGGDGGITSWWTLHWYSTGAVHQKPPLKVKRNAWTDLPRLTRLVIS